MNSSPLFVTFAIAITNFLGILVFWWIAQRYFGWMVGLFTGVTLAVSPWLNYYGGFIWEPNILIPFLGLAIVVGFLGYIERNIWAQVIFAPLFLAAIQLHFAAFFLAPLYLILLWIGRKNIVWKPTILSCLLGLLVLLPFAYGLSLDSGNSSNRFETITEILQAGVRLRFEPIEQVMNLITGLNTESLLRNQARNFLSSTPNITPVWQVFLVFTAASFILVWRKKWRIYAPFLLFWAISTPLMQIPAWTGRGVFLHYHLGAIPAYGFLIAITIVSIIDFLKILPFSRIFQLGFVIACSILYLSQALWMWQLYRNLDSVYSYSDSRGTQGRTATPIHYLMDVREALAAYDDVLILGANPFESNYFIWQAMLYDTATCVRDLLIIDGVVDVLPQGPFAVLVAPLKPINANYQVPARYQNDSPTVINLRPDEDPYIIYHFDAAPDWTETEIIPVEANAFENGLRLSGYYLGTDWLQLRWEIPSNGGDTFQYYVHFLDANGERIGQRDTPFYVGQAWCAGDTVFTSVLATIPAGTRTLRVGLYRLFEDGSTLGLPLLDNLGNPNERAVDISLP